MRYFEIAQRPRIPTATDRIVRDERHVPHDTGQIWPRGESLRVSGNAAKAKSHSAAMASRHAPVPRSLSRP